MYQPVTYSKTTGAFADTGDVATTATSPFFLLSNGTLNGTLNGNPITPITASTPHPALNEPPRHRHANQHRPTKYQHQPTKKGSLCYPFSY